ncbi:MAG: UDP-glucose 4-epimerase GalE [Clostridia bacterium]|jgi:UDP-glucose 4-epimerase|uniref:UDP-glucose 4-epimerase GalE n=1 Tax=Sporofaciens musculi TaxID=2681861 RepID=UPI0025A2E02D|nr:UDP-glucose 4-epimerase GalE [Sporofaciens musculi]MCI8362971.1 UDP-glucose 4-epimerase GalE [Clostridia bacterium]
MILVTGGAGYIGSHINKKLHQNGYGTVVFDNLVYGHREAVKWGTLEVGDLSDTDKLEDIFMKYNIDAVFHFAAYAYVGESVKNPQKYYNNNVVNTLHLLDTMVKYNVKHFIFSSTCATYGVPEELPITEEMKQIPINPYGVSKLMIERILEDYHRAYELNYCCLRYFNAAGADPESEIGESHTPETHLIPLILAAAAGDRENIRVFGTDYPTRDGSCIRDYIHVTDLADAHVKAMDYLKNGGESTCFNLGNCTGNSVLEVIGAAKEITGKDIPAVFDERRQGDPPILVGSANKAERVLGWKPQYGDINTIMEHAWKWYCIKRY